LALDPRWETNAIFHAHQHFPVALAVLEDEASHVPLVVDPIIEGSGIESLEINIGPFEKKCLDLMFRGDFNGGMKTSR